jgi:uncharacterized protein HemY
MLGRMRAVQFIVAMAGVRNIIQLSLKKWRSNMAPRKTALSIDRGSYNRFYCDVAPRAIQIHQPYICYYRGAHMAKKMLENHKEDEVPHREH